MMRSGTLKLALGPRIAAACSPAACAAAGGASSLRPCPWGWGLAEQQQQRRALAAAAGRDSRADRYGGVAGKPTRRADSPHPPPAQPPPPQQQPGSSSGAPSVAPVEPSVLSSRRWLQRVVPLQSFRAVGVSFDSRQSLIPQLHRGAWARGWQRTAYACLCRRCLPWACWLVCACSSCLPACAMPVCRPGACACSGARQPSRPTRCGHPHPRRPKRGLHRPRQDRILPAGKPGAPPRLPWPVEGARHWQLSGDALPACCSLPGGRPAGVWRLRHARLHPPVCLQDLCFGAVGSVGRQGEEGLWGFTVSGTLNVC